MSVNNAARPVGNVYDLDELIPKDIGFKFAGEEYRIPGDMAIDTTYSLFELFAEMVSAQGEAVSGTVKKREQNAQRATAAVKALELFVLDLFKLRQPDLDALPFGISGLLAVVRSILIEVGAISPDVPADEVPERPLASKPAPRRATSVKKKPAARSRRSG